ncbi:MAG: hypothetical protein HYZ27_04975, partial [Deltaproteobacteria bacterium]|nr:hypothetical protein [Deltaproteobacteria bacterium]
LLERITQLTATQGAGMTIQQREEGMARREQRVAERERKVAEREKELADREAEVTKNLQALAGMMGDFKGVRTVAVPAAMPSPANVSRNDVQKLQRQVKTRMNSKGVLLADLPPAARDLDSAAKTAINDKDFAAAHTALEQLSQMIDALKVDHTFVQAKFTRINRSAEGKVNSLDEAQRKRVSALLDEVSESFNDGRYDRANRKINQIHSLLEGGSE